MKKQGKEVAIRESDAKPREQQKSAVILSEPELFLGAPVVQKVKPKVVEEDVYVEAMTEIIERDFFPNLSKMKKQNQLLDAIADSDILKANQLGYELSRMSTATPITNSQNAPTPRPYTPHQPSEGTTEHQNPQPPSLKTSKLSLDQFLTKYTSEDNSSFENIIEQTNANTKEKYSWIFDQEKKQLVLEGPVKDLEGKQGPLGLLEQSSNDPSLKGKIEYWRFNPKNELMNFPVGAPLTTDDVEIKGAPKSITHSATRFENASKLSSTKNLLDPAAADERLRTQRLWTDMHNATPALHRGVSESPKVGGYGFVNSTPSPAPHQEGIDPDELMTWGAIEGTPLLLDGIDAEDSGGARFSIAATPRRDEIASKLAEKAAKNIRKRDAETQPFKKPTSRFLSPAAHKLLQKTTSSSSFGGSLRKAYGSDEYSKIRKSTIGLSPSPLNTSIRKNYTPTPIIHHVSKRVKTSVGNLGQDITDDLLNL